MEDAPSEVSTGDLRRCPSSVSESAIACRALLLIFPYEDQVLHDGAFLSSMSWRGLHVEIP